MKLIKDLGMLYATENSKRKYRYGLYECPVCIKHFRVKTSDVKSKSTTKCKSCGATRHGQAKSKLYKIFSNMKTRCYNKKNDDYKNYGNRGISICDEWLNDYMAFREWALNNGYESNLTIDRENNDGNYEPSNCRWTTPTVQARNTRKLRVDNSSGYRGVSWRKRDKKWAVNVSVNSVQKSIGYFDYPWTAAYAYDSYIIKHDLEHTRNFMV